MTATVIADVQQARDTALAAIASARSLDDLDAAKAGVLGKKGELTRIQRELGGMAPEARREVGAAVNAAREAVLAADQQRRATLESERDRIALAAEAIDVTLPARTPKRGSLHPVHETMEAMLDALVGLGFAVESGPEVESDWFNFQALNIPRDHPARAMTDTIYVRGLAEADADDGGDLLLRTHTSPVQARTMLAQPPPLYIVAPGRVYRQDTPDATHLPAFHQIEGLAVDEGLSMADLRGTLAQFIRALLGSETKIRLRPSYFPFTEPSCEVDALHEGRWLELLGAGMVHPNVLRHVGYDPEQVQGFAFGIGVERVAMLRHGISDLRLLIENDLRFLSAF